MNINRNLNNISLLAFGFVALVVVINLFTTNNYGKANNEVVAALSGTDHIANYHMLRTIAEGNNEGSWLLIDLRSPEDFQKGHLPGAINIPFDKLLDKSSIKQIRKGKDTTPILYSDSESQAHAARLLLLAKGEDKPVMVLGGTYEKAMAHAIEKFEPSFANYKDEKARFDFRRFMNISSDAQPQRAPRPSGVVPAVQVQVTAAQGGC